jgi:hypothetical protein
MGIGSTCDTPWSGTAWPHVAATARDEQRRGDLSNLDFNLTVALPTAGPRLCRAKALFAGASRAVTLR